MPALICGSLAFDTIMTFEGRFAEQILPDQLHILNVSFLVPALRRDFGGCAGNIAYALKLLGGEPLSVAAVREAREECGLEVRLDGLVNIYSYAGRTPVIVVYAATAIGGTLCPDDECLEAGAFAADGIPWDELAFRSTREGLQDYLAGMRHQLSRE